MSFPVIRLVFGVGAAALLTLLLGLGAVDFEFVDGPEAALISFLNDAEKAGGSLRRQVDREHRPSIPHSHRIRPFVPVLTYTKLILFREVVVASAGVE